MYNNTIWSKFLLNNMLLLAKLICLSSRLWLARGAPTQSAAGHSSPALREGIDNCLPSAFFAILALLLLFLLRFALVVILLCLGLFALDRFEVAFVGTGGSW